jgi:hypothetical protein
MGKRGTKNGEILTVSSSYILSSQTKLLIKNSSKYRFRTCITVYVRMSGKNKSLGAAVFP